jgi:hypothetical protein
MHCSVSAADKIVALPFERINGGLWPYTSPHHLIKRVGEHGARSGVPLDFWTFPQTLVPDRLSVSFGAPFPHACSRRLGSRT